MGRYNTLLQAECQHPKDPKARSQAPLAAIVDMWNVMLGLGDSQEYEKAEETLQEMMDIKNGALFQGQNPHPGSDQASSTLPFWAAASFNPTISTLLSQTIEIEANSKYRCRGLL